MDDEQERVKSGRSTRPPGSAVSNPYEPPPPAPAGVPHQPKWTFRSQLVVIPAALSYFFAVIFVATAAIGFIHLLDLWDPEHDIGLSRGIIVFLMPSQFAIAFLLNLFAGHRWLQRRYFVAALANGMSFVWLSVARRVSASLVDSLL